MKSLFTKYLERTERRAQRDALLGRYRNFRSAISTHLNAALKCVSISALRDAARRTGLLTGGVIVTDHFSEETLAYDLAVFGQKPGHSRAIDRYARSHPYPPGSPEAITLEAMQSNIFRIVRVKHRHPIAGQVVEDIAYQNELWLLDEGLEQSLKEGNCLALRLIPIESFYTTVGAIVPMTDTLLSQALSALTPGGGPSDLSALDDPRLPQAIYTAAVRSGIMQNMDYRD